ncbi:1-acyl-sn-glycerol-3-phosphate acyltransferase [Roseomonas terrae]|uniref:1-acyl-sn-glycerol-3-phosphate acyltransferase n=2 Tax=Neoroseomonas terrae TaxID=424799 RepID=A0ABS5EBC7_9PROT|nr:1-acyl-sn-glycerol-3-phosphate acyltransferase [Neoroseomonas terrae]
MDAVARAPQDALKPRRLLRRSPLNFQPWIPGAAWADVMEPRPLGGRFRAVRRIVTAFLWTLIAVPIQVVLIRLSSRGAMSFACTYHRVLCWLIGLKVQVIGRPSASPSVLYVSNHSSWLDILVLGAVLRAAFVSKAEVGQWPVAGTVARLGRTIFVSRKRSGTGKEAEEIQQRLAAGDSVILFPEGTSNDGTRVLPFRSSFLTVAQGAKQVQPVSLVYDRLGGLPACRRDRPFFAWYGDMDLATHFWRIARRSGARATVLLHDPADPADFPDRKALTAAASEVVAEGASLLRQNRPVAPLPLRAPQERG